MSAVKYVYVGRTTNFKGKTLWEIVGNLKNFGVGRIIIRNVFQRYPEPSFMKILKVEPLANEETRKVKVTVEKVFRGRKYPRPHEICSTSYKADYILIPREEEYKYSNIDNTRSVKIFSSTVEFPPLLKELHLQDLVAQGFDASKEPRLKVILQEGRDSMSRVAQDGETPTHTVTMGLGKPASPSLYEGV